MGLAIAALWRRDVTRFLRQRSRVVGSLATPVLFWVLLGSGLGRSFQAGTADTSMGYLAYFLPGTLALIVLFTAIFSTISVIEDRQEGFLQGVLVAPVPRAAIVLGKVSASTTLALLNAAVFLAVAPIAGVSVPWLHLPAAFAVLMVMALGLSALGLVIAWPLASTQGFHAIMNLLLVPMWLLSGAVFPAEGATDWMQAVMSANPLAYGMTALRAALDGRLLTGAAAGPLGVMAAFGAVMLVAVTVIVSVPRRE
jgi:ABC-2 type transport system permease protein